MHIHFVRTINKIALRALSGIQISWQTEHTAPMRQWAFVVRFFNKLHKTLLVRESSRFKKDGHLSLSKLHNVLEKH